MTYEEAKEKVLKCELVDEAYDFVASLTDFSEDRKLDVLEYFIEMKQN